MTSGSFCAHFKSSHVYPGRRLVPGSVTILWVPGTKGSPLRTWLEFGWSGTLNVCPSGICLSLLNDGMTCMCWQHAGCREKHAVCCNGAWRNGPRFILPCQQNATKTASNDHQHLLDWNALCCSKPSPARLLPLTWPVILFYILTASFYFVEQGSI